MNAGKMAIGEGINSPHSNHPGVLQKGIWDSIKYHQRLEGKTLYITEHRKPKRRYSNSLFSKYNKIRVSYIISTLLSSEFTIRDPVAGTTLMTTYVEASFSMQVT